MTKEHYNLIIKKTNQFKGKLDGDDFSEICFGIDQLSEDQELYNELFHIMNAMYCEHGMDYGKVQENWDDVTIKIVNEFKNGYKSNEKNLDILLKIIKDERKM